VVTAIADSFQLVERVTSRERVIPGGEKYPINVDQLQEEQQRLADTSGLGLDTIQSIWSLCGTSISEVISDLCNAPSEQLVGTNLPLACVDRVIQHEWVTTLDDLVERRLMLLFQPDLSRETLKALADHLVHNGKLNAADVDNSVESVVLRLRDVYGKRVERSTDAISSEISEMSRTATIPTPANVTPVSNQPPEGT
jgi:glycerol-3-phosphate dehydrogenase